MMANPIEDINTVTPDADSLAHSKQLEARIIDEIQQAGSIGFDRFMELALYAPGMGYYTAGSQKFGASGDFITAPEISPLFSQCVALQCEQVLLNLPGSILEFGAGSGVMAAHILLRLEKLGCLPERYLILDISADLKPRQRDTIQSLAPHLLERVEWISALPESFEGIILANELLDAMPVNIFSRINNQLLEQVVTFENDELKPAWQPVSPVLEKAVESLEQRFGRFAEGYLSEVNLRLQGWLSALADCLDKGVMFLIDYGYTAFEYYHPDRKMGTLICHYQHRAHDNPFILTGLQDITANVDFSAVADAARMQGLSVEGYTPQANFLMSCGIEQLLQEYSPEDADQFLNIAQGVKALMLPQEMGERFKVIALSKNYPQSKGSELLGFRMRNLRDRL